MPTNESYIQHLKAEIARWFSKDGVEMSVYYAQDGNSYPVTRDEQDRCLAQAYGYVAGYADALAKPSSNNGLRILLFILFWPCVLFTFSESMFPFSVVGLLPMGYLTYLVWTIGDRPRRVCQRQIKSLRAEFETRILFRNAVVAVQKRQNSFKYANWIAFGILCVLAMFGRTIISTTGIDERSLMVVFLALIAGFFGPSLLFDKLNAANIRQTGKWFRWPRRN